jgi:hypothetical protein
MFNEKNKLCYFLIFILVLSIILITRKYNKDANNILIPSIIISFLIMYFNKDLGLFILVLSFVMFFVLQNNCKTENFGSESLEEIFGLSENEDNKKRNTELAKTITDKFMNKLNTQLIGLNQLITDNQKYIKTASDNYTTHCVKGDVEANASMTTGTTTSPFTNTKIPEQIKENFPRGNVPDIKNVAFKQTKHNYVTCIKDNEKIHSYGEPLDNPNYSNEERNKLGTNFYPLNK